MSPHDVDVEERLTRALRSFVSDVPEQPPVSWDVYAVTQTATATATVAVGATGRGPGHHWHRAVGIAASVLLIVLGTLLWASPSAGARHQGAAVRVSAPTVQLDGSNSCGCVPSP